MYIYVKYGLPLICLYIYIYGAAQEDMLVGLYAKFYSSHTNTCVVKLDTKSEKDRGKYKKQSICHAHIKWGAQNPQSNLDFFNNVEL